MSFLRAARLDLCMQMVKQVLNLDRAKEIRSKREQHKQPFKSMEKTFKNKKLGKKLLIQV